MEKRVLLAVILSVAVLYGYQAMVPPPKRPVPAAAPASQTPAPASQNLEQPSATPAPAVPAAQPLVAEAAERQIVVESDAVRAVFSTRGAVLTSWRLKRYAENGAPLDLVPEQAPANSDRKSVG